MNIIDTICVKLLSGWEVRTNFKEDKIVEKKLIGPTIVLYFRVMPNLLHGLHQKLTHSCHVHMCIS